MLIFQIAIELNCNWMTISRIILDPDSEWVRYRERKLQLNNGTDKYYSLSVPYNMPLIVANNSTAKGSARTPFRPTKTTDDDWGNRVVHTSTCSCQWWSLLQSCVCSGAWVKVLQVTKNTLILVTILPRHSCPGQDCNRNQCIFCNITKYKSIVVTILPEARS